MQSISEFNAPRKSGPYRLAYRYIPGALGTGSTLDNGAVMTEECSTQEERDQLLAVLRADKRIQWAGKVE